MKNQEKKNQNEILTESIENISINESESIKSTDNEDRESLSSSMVKIKDKAVEKKLEKIEEEGNEDSPSTKKGVFKEFYWKFYSDENCRAIQYVTGKHSSIGIQIF